GYVKEIAGIRADEQEDLTIKERQDISEASSVRVLDKKVEQEMKDRIDQAKADGDSIGGVVEVYVEGMPAGVGSYVQADRKVDAKLAGAVMSINAFKGVEIGLGLKRPERMVVKFTMKLCGTKPTATTGIQTDSVVLRVVRSEERRVGKECRGGGAGKCERENAGRNVRVSDDGSMSDIT